MPGLFLLYRKLLSCKVKNAARGCAKAHSLFYERKKKTGESEQKCDGLQVVVGYGGVCRGYPDAKRGRDVSGGRYGLPDPAEIESEDSAGSGDDDRICCHAG